MSNASLLGEENGSTFADCNWFDSRLFSAAFFNCSTAGKIIPAGISSRPISSRYWLLASLEDSCIWDQDVEDSPELRLSIQV